MLVNSIMLCIMKKPVRPILYTLHYLNFRPLFMEILLRREALSSRHTDDYFPSQGPSFTNRTRKAAPLPPADNRIPSSLCTDGSDHDFHVGAELHLLGL